jgi:hypothetical protein
MQIASFFITEKHTFLYQLRQPPPTKLLFYPTCISIKKDNAEVIKQ